MIEIVSQGVSAQRTRIALFDFDGTLSTIRSGWKDVMVPLMVRALTNLKQGETGAEVLQTVEAITTKFPSHQTMAQMVELVFQIHQRGAEAADPLEYHRQYLDALWQRTGERIEAIKSGTVPPDAYLVPGSRALLESLRARGLKLYLASGATEAALQNEARLLDIARYFDGGIYGVLDHHESSTKAALLETVIQSAQVRGEELLAFGDGAIETEVVKNASGITVGVATAEPDCLTVDDAKRNLLIDAGADFIIPNYLETGELFQMLFPAEKQTRISQ